MRDAGAFADWAVAMQDGMRTGRGSDVPCDGCVACCTSGQTISVSDAEAEALPAGSVVDGALARVDGRCVLLVDDACTAYDVRPVQCRTYDCRIFPAAGLAPEGDKPAIASAAAEWVFRYDRPEDRRRQEAVRTAVVMIRTGQTGGRPTSATQLAAAAVAVHDELLG